MIYVLIILLVLVAVVIIIMLTELKLWFHLTQKQNRLYLAIKATIWFGLIQVQKEWQLMQLAFKNIPELIYHTETETKGEPVHKEKHSLSLSKLIRLKRQMERMIKQIKDLKVIIIRFARKINLDCLEWRSSLGTGYADETGVLLGIAWAVKAAITGLLQRYVKMGAPPQLSIHPYFREKKWETDLQCMIRFRIGYAILAGIRILLNLRKRRDSLWKSTPFKV